MKIIQKNKLNTVILISLFFPFIFINSEQAEARYASIIIDAKTGKVLHASNPDRQKKLTAHCVPCHEEVCQWLLSHQHGTI